MVARAENKNGVRWECLCDCGERKIIRSSNLKEAGTMSCGCLNREEVSKAQAIDYLGKRFGDCVVIRQTESRKRLTWWVLRCGCGNEFEVSSRTLREKKRISCGCMRSIRWHVPELGQMACELPSDKYPDGRTGTYAGYQAHVKVGETPCTDCDSARTEYNRSHWAGQTQEERQDVRAKNAIAAKLYREMHPNRRTDIASKRRMERVPIIREAKDKPCSDCGVQYPYYVMQFDHVRGEKKFNIGQGWNNSIQALTEEIAKCDIVCANCHAERTYQRLVN